jgi:hypothetical protein
MEDQVKYMVIDYSSVEKTALLKVAYLRQSQLWGQLYAAEGRMVMAPVLDTRSFTKFDGGTLQYLYWNTVKHTPPDDYQLLVQKCVAAIRMVPVDETSIEELEARVAALGLQDEAAEPAKKKAPATPSAKPKGTSTTGRVWEIASSLVVGKALPDRKAVVAACEAEGINPSTASTQYGKWRHSQVS